MMLRAGLLGLAMLQIGWMDQPAKPKQYVTYGSDPQSVPAGKKSFVELHFRVGEGFHVNSHTPASELLIPTNLAFQPAAGVKVGAAEYPKGQPYSFSFSPKEKLDVYAGDFTVRVPVEAAAGEHTVSGLLRYQACDRAACYPPKTLAVSVVVVAK